MFFEVGHDHRMDPKPYSILDWDTKHFGFKTARLHHPNNLQDTLRLLRAEGVALAYLFLAAEDKRAQQEALQAGGVLVDEKRTYAGEIQKIAAQTPAQEVEAYQGEARPDLLALAVESGRYSRFRVDPRFPVECFTRLYHEWMINSLKGEIAEKVFVVRRGAQITGMVTLDQRPGRANIGIIAVAESERGKGLGKALVGAGARWALTQNLSQGQVLTQGANQEACRLYERCGYSLEKTELVYHFWPS